MVQEGGKWKLGYYQVYLVSACFPGSCGKKRRTRR